MNNFNVDTYNNIVKKNDKIVTIIERSINKNIIVFEANISNCVYNDPPINTYWLELDPKYKKKKRKKGILTNKCELNIIEKKFIYKLKYEYKKDLIKMNIACVPNINYYLGVKDNKPIIYSEIRGILCDLKYIYVKFKLPKIEYVDVYGYNNSELINERIFINKKKFKKINKMLTIYKDKYLNK